MKKNKININKRFILLLLCIMGWVSITVAQEKTTTVSATVVNEQNEPLEGVSVLGGKSKFATSNAQGVFTIEAESNEKILLEKEGYESILIGASEVSGEITMLESAYLLSDDDEINLGFYTAKKKDLVGAVASIKPPEFAVYDNTQWAKSAIEGRMLGVKGSTNIRGLGEAMVVIDGIPGRNLDFLNMDEVQEITILKDASAVALYGSQARNGVIVVTTKKGQLYNNKAEVSVNYSHKEPISLPKYLSAVEYMELYNVARSNDGQLPFYEQSLIDAYNQENNPYKYPDVDLYSNDYLKSSTNSVDVVTQFSGGTDKLLYYVNAGWNRDASLEELNSNANAGSNRFNVRGNLDFKVTDWIRSSVGVLSVINVNKTANESILSVGTSLKPNDYAPLLPVSMVANDPALQAELASANIYNGSLLGTSLDAKLNAPIANILAGGDRKYYNQTSQFNNSIDFDLSRITEGLSAKTYLSFDFYDQSTKSRTNEYKVYYPTWEGDSIVGLQSFGNDKKDLTENASTRDFVSRFGAYAQVSYIKELGENHSVDATAIGYYNSTSVEGEIQSEKNAHIGFHVGYQFKNKLLADFNGNYSNSIKLADGSKGAFSPTLGLAYILSEENFLKDNSFINYLKLRASAGIIHSDIGITEYFLYKTIYERGGWHGWADGQQSNNATITSQVGNPNLGYEKRNDINLGFEALLFSSLWVEFNAFQTDITDQLTILSNSYPSFYTDFRPSSNYDEDRYKGFELGVNYTKDIGDFNITAGGNLLYTKSEQTLRDEVNEFAYEQRQGREVEAIWGFKDLGFYDVDDFDANGDLLEGLPTSSFGAVQPGDIKYEDKNGDGSIDNNDRQVIGRHTNPLSYAVNLLFEYKGISLFVLGTGQSGGEGNLTANKYNDYYNVDGSDKYSEIVRGHWTPETANSANYPRLTSASDNHNYQNSTFWLYDNSFFKINRAQLTYEFNDNLCKKLRMKKLSVNVSGSNLLHVSTNKDIRELNIGSAPQYRYFSVGLRTTF